jgi:hypothetical protein
MYGRSENMLSRGALSLTGRWATVLLMITAWMFLSNHCALGLGGVTANLESEPGACPMHSAPAKEKPAANLPCCKELRAVVTHATKSVAAVASQLGGVQNYVAPIFLMPPRLMTQLLALNTGPPHLLSFAESILQRSILAHAPPEGFPRL